jgi:hypothetical protein
LRSRVPDFDLVTSPQTEPSAYVAACRDSEGHSALVYFPVAGQSVTLNLEKLSGAHLQTWWYDPRTGGATPADTFDHSASRTFTAPADETDWVLVIDDLNAGFPPPGKT